MKRTVGSVNPVMILVPNLVLAKVEIDTCEKSSCVPTYQKCTIAARNRCQLMREIIEAEIIHSLGDNFASKPSITLSSKESRYLWCH